MEVSSALIMPEQNYNLYFAQKFQQQFDFYFTV